MRVERKRTDTVSAGLLATCQRVRIFNEQRKIL